MLKNELPITIYMYILSHFGIKSTWRNNHTFTSTVTCVSVSGFVCQAVDSTPPLYLGLPIVGQQDNYPGCVHSWACKLSLF